MRYLRLLRIIDKIFFMFKRMSIKFEIDYTKRINPKDPPGLAYFVCPIEIFLCSLALRYH
jgi:hypothetical protein